MAKNGFKVMDSDMHVVEPPDLWQRYIDPEFQDRAPRGFTDPLRFLLIAHPDGKPWGRTDQANDSNRQNLEGRRTPIPTRFFAFGSE